MHVQQIWRPAESIWHVQGSVGFLTGSLLSQPLFVLAPSVLIDEWFGMFCRVCPGLSLLSVRVFHRSVMLTGCRICANLQRHFLGSNSLAIIVYALCDHWDCPEATAFIRMCHYVDTLMDATGSTQTSYKSHLHASQFRKSIIN